MNRRERILAAIAHRPLDRIPTDIWATPEVYQKLYAHLGVESTQAVWDLLEIDGIPGVGPRYVGPALATGEEYWENYWGMGYRRQTYATGAYNEQVHYPLATADSIADLESYRWPDPEWFDYGAIREAAALWPGRAIMCGYTAPAYYHLQLRGQELSLMDPILRPEFTAHLLGRLSDFFTEYHRRCFEAGRGTIDVTQVTDDWGAQRGLLVSPRIFDRYYRAPTQRAIDLAREYDLVVFHHDDGDMRALLSRLAEMGIQVLNPVQWRCGDWDLAALKAEYGDRICFHGGVDNQSTLPFGTPEDVRREVKWLVETLACDGTGFILAPCHNLQAVSPVENILALYEAAREYGQFAR
jgi:uroporphyrinogen decarboxylase